jgi:cysteine desulfurase
MIFADNNSTTQPSETTLAWIREASETWGNPSSAHRLGRKALELLEKSRIQVAKLAGVEPQEVVFTSGGSEANSLALCGTFYSTPGFRLLTSGVEHSSIRDCAHFLKNQKALINLLPVDSNGLPSLEELELKLRNFKPHLASLMTANNETGVVFPIPEIIQLCKAYGVPFHTDAVQALGKIPSDFWNQADLISLSAHKINGPKGCGALIIRGNLQLTATHFGGSQEVKRRGGTENLMGIAGFGGACFDKLRGETPSTEILRDRFENHLIQNLEGIHIQGYKSPRLSNTSNVRFEGVLSEILLGALDLDGIYVSAGSACSSGSISPSHVLLEMGLSHSEAKECLRFSWGRFSTEEEVDITSKAVVNHVLRIRQRKSNGQPR